jgi:hypothetical protein
MISLINSFHIFIASTIVSNVWSLPDKACIDVGHYFHHQYKQDILDSIHQPLSFTTKQAYTMAKTFKFSNYHQPDELKTDEKDIVNMAEQLQSVFHPEADLEQSKKVMNAVNELYDKHVSTLGTGDFFEALRIAVSNATGFR